MTDPADLAYEHYAAELDSGVDLLDPDAYWRGYEPPEEAPMLVLTTRRTDPVAQARTVLDQRQSSSRRWYPFNEEEKRAVRVLQAAKAVR